MKHLNLADRDDSFLLIIDVQAPLLGVMPQSERLIKNIQTLIEAAKTLHLPLFATEQYPERFGPTVESIRSRWGVVQPEGKLVFSSYGCLPMVRKIQESNRRTALLCGIETHVCVSQTAHDLLADGYTVHIPADAVDSRTALNRETGLEKLRSSGALITTTEMLIFELLQKAGTPEFKALLPHIK
jgi:nicotinamidase-related amidase